MGLAALFHSGQLAEVVRRAESTRRVPAQSEIHHHISALLFLGRIKEGELTFHESRRELLPGQLAECLFFLTIARTRVSRYTEAKATLDELERLARVHSEPEIQYFAFQARGFVHYYLGAYAESVLAALAALKVAPRLKSAYYLALAKDLFGQARLQLGDIHVGLKYIEEALDLLKEVGNSTLHDAIAAARLGYRAQFGLTPDTIVGELESALRQVRYQDSYSQANLGLELARQYTLRGRYGDALAELERVAPLVYQHENRRQEIVLNLRFAEIHYHRHEHFLVEHFTRAARRCLSFEVDAAFTARVLGLELKLAQRLKRPVELLQTELDTVSRQLTSRWNNQLCSRAQATPEDPLGRKLDLLQRAAPADKAEIIFEGPYWGFLATQFAPMKPGTLALDLTPGSLTVFTNGQIRHHRKVSKQTHELVRALLVVRSKARLVQEVWGYTYDPLRHDPMVYAAIAQLRRLLGREAASRLVHSEKGYELQLDLFEPPTSDRYIRKVMAEPLRVASVPTSLGVSARPDLNYRQLKILDELDIQDTGEPLTVRDWQKRFRVSLITASRDLSQLYSAGLITRIGKGRATVYVKRRRV